MITLSNFGKERLNREHEPYISRLNVLNIFPEENILKIDSTNHYWKYQETIRKDIYKKSAIKSILDTFDIKETSYSQCILNYLMCINHNLHKSYNALINYFDCLGSKLKAEQAIELLGLWKQEPHWLCNNPNDKKYRDMLWLQVLDHINSNSSLLLPYKDIPENMNWCIDLGILVSKNRKFSKQHDYYPVVGEDTNTFNLVSTILDSKISAWLEFIPKEMINREPSNKQCYILETGHKVSSVKVKEFTFHCTEYLIASNHKILFDKIMYDLRNIIPTYALCIKYYINLRKEDTTKYLNLDTGRLCKKVPKESIVDESRMIFTKDKAKLEYYQKQIAAFALQTPSAPAPSASRPRARKEQIPKAVRLEVWEKYNPNMTQGQCVICMANLSIGNFHCGHIQAEAEGGRAEINNLVPICQLCNLSMGKKNMIDFIYATGFDKKNPKNERLHKLLSEYKDEEFQLL